MKILLARKPEVNKFKIFLFITLAIVATIFILSSILYMNFESVSLQVIYRFAHENLSQVSFSTDFMDDYAKNFGMQVYFDNQITSLLYGSPGYLNLAESLNRLSFFSLSSPFIDSIYVWNGKINKIFTSTGANLSFSKSDFFDREAIDIIDNSSFYTKLVPIPRRITLPNARGSIDETKNVYSYLFYESLKTQDRLDAAILINVSEKWLRKTIDALNSYPDSETFIINRKGQLVISSSDKKMLEDISNEAYIKNILSEKNSSGYFVSTIYGNRFLVTFLQSKVTDWFFIRLIPYHDITSKIKSMKLITFSIAFIILIAGLIVSFIISRKIYHPIGKMMTEISNLKEEKRNNYYNARQNILNNILKGKESINAGILEKHLKSNNIKLNTAGSFVLVMFIIDNFSAFCKAYNLSDRRLLKFAVLNIASELLGSVYVNEGIETEGDHVVLLLDSNEQGIHDEDEQFLDILKKIQETVLGLYNISLSCVITPQAEFMELPDSYNTALNAASHKLFKGRKCILFSGEIHENEIQSYRYPVDSEKLLVEALMSGKLDDAKKAYREIVNSFVDYPIIILQANLLRLVIAVDGVIKSLGYDINNNFSKFTSDLNKCEIIEDIDALYFQLFETIVAEHNTWKNSKHEQLLNRIYDIVESQFANKNLSLESIADKLGMSPVYLGRLFKKLTSNSVSSYITDVRIKKAKNFLLSKDIPINEIADRVGFSTVKYFFTLFKKVSGVTPNEFRVKQKQK